MAKCLKNLMMKLFIGTVFLVTLALGSRELYAEGQVASENWESIIRPEQVVRLFYKHLMADHPATQCPEIFDEPEILYSALPKDIKKAYAKRSKSAAVWGYLRQNKELFTFPYPNKPNQLDVLRFWYLFTTFPEGAPFSDGRLTVVAYGTPLRNQEQGKGVVKMVMFPMEKNPKGWGSPYLINIVAVKINGISAIDPTKQYSRSGNLYELLGFEIGPPAKHE